VTEGSIDGRQASREQHHDEQQIRADEAGEDPSRGEGVGDAAKAACATVSQKERDDDGDRGDAERLQKVGHAHPPCVGRAHRPAACARDESGEARGTRWGRRAWSRAAHLEGHEESIAADLSDHLSAR